MANEWKSLCFGEACAPVGFIMIDIGTDVQLDEYLLVSCWVVILSMVRLLVHRLSAHRSNEYAVAVSVNHVLDIVC